MLTIKCVGGIMMKKKSNMWLKFIIGCGLTCSIVATVVFMENINWASKMLGRIDDIPHNERQHNLTFKQQLIVEGDKTQEKEYLQYKALHDAFPTNKVYLANYIGHCNRSEDFSAEMLYREDYQKNAKNKKIRENFLATQKKFTHLLKYAQKIDPDNALYAILQADVLFKEALFYDLKKTKGFAVAEEYKTSNTKKEKPLFRHDDYKVGDAKKLNLAVAQFLEALEKPYLKSYASDYILQKADILCPNPVDLEDHLYQLSVIVKFNLFYLKNFREAVRYIRAAIIYNYEQGNYDECEILLATCQPYVELQLEHCYDIVECMVAQSSAKIYYEAAIDYYHARKNNKLAEFYQQKYDAIECIKQAGTDIDLDDYRKKSGGMSTMLLPAIIFEEKETLKAKLYPDNIVTYKVIEQSIVAILIALQSIVLVISAVSIISSRTTFDFIKPSKFELIKIVVLGLFLPMGLYLTITNIDILSGRENNIAANSIAAIFQFWLLILSTFLPLSLIVKNIVKKYCLKKNIEAPNFKIGTWSYVTFYLIIAAMSVKVVCNNSFTMNLITVIFTIFIVIILIVKCIIVILEYRPFAKLLLKNIFVYMTVFPIISLLVLFAIFKYQECYYISKDELVYNKGESRRCLTPLEYQSTQKLKELFQKEILDK